MKIDKAAEKAARSASSLAVDSGEFPTKSNSAPLSELVTLSEQGGRQAEAVRALRTHIVAQHLDEGRRAIALCAASSDVGCTFTAANLAVALSQIGIKTILIDADLRAPGVDRFLPGPTAQRGLAQFLDSSDGIFSDYIAADILPGLSVMYAGGAASNPQELLAGERFRELMEACMRDFDATIVDTPPANTSSDARRISTVVGYSLIVTRRNVTFINDVKTLISQLQGDHAKVVGTVLNEA